MIQMYENLDLRNEFIDALRNYTILIFNQGDLNKIKDLFLRYSLLDVTNRLDGEDVIINGQESVTNLISMLDSNLCRLQGIDHSMINQIH